MNNNSNNRKIIVGITHGDPNGIGYEVIVKAFADERMLEICTPVIYGSSKVFGFYKKTVHEVGHINTNVISSASEARAKMVNIVNCIPETFYVEPGQPSVDSAKCALESLKRAIREIKEGKIDALVTAPFNKKVMNADGFGFTGHTEFLEKEFGVNDAVMFMASDSLKIAVATQHIPLRNVPDSISSNLILGKLRLMKQSLERDFGIPSPKIAVLGLNPHCGDGGLVGDEEQQHIIPAVEAAVKEGILAFGPYSPDGFFGTGAYARFDAVLAMYHDQGLIPFKSLIFGSGVNYTAGLPIVRTSPDHGTAFEIAGRDEADPSSMTSAIYAAVDICNKRREYDALMKSRPVLKTNSSEFSQKDDIAE